MVHYDILKWFFGAFSVRTSDGRGSGGGNGGGGGSSSGGSGGGSGAPSVTFTFDTITVALLLSSVLYGFCFILAKRKLSTLHRINPEFGTKKLLVLSVLLVCFIRIMTFIGVATMNIANVRAHYSLKPLPSPRRGTDDDDDDTGYNGQQDEDKNQNFYDESMTVLFDLPNTIVVSTYVLLTLVWAECFLESRFHTESAVMWKSRWLKSYMGFNACLYATQMILYTLIFATTSSTVVRTVLYAAMTGINFITVTLVLALYIYLGVRFSGYPFRSNYARQSLSKISGVLALWSVSRIVFGVVMLVVFIKNMELLQDTSTPLGSFFLLLLLFFVCEILPIIAMLDYSYTNIIGFENDGTRDMGILDVYSRRAPLLPLSHDTEEEDDMEDDDEMLIEDDGDEVNNPAEDIRIDRETRVRWLDESRSV